nr:DUF2345 domain-containing protein [Dyella sedimenti]
MGHGANDEPNGTGGGEPVVAVSAPAGIAVATPRSIALVAGQQLNAVAQDHMQLTSGGRTVLNAADSLGLFTQGGELRAIAHQGPVLVQAQHNKMQLQAQQSVEITSSQSHVLAAAQKRLTLMCGGAYLRMEGGNIELGMPGTFTVKASSHAFIGPSSASAAFNQWDATPFDQVYVVRDEATLKPLANTLVELCRQDGTSLRLTTDAEGRLPIQKSLLMERMVLRIVGAAAPSNDTEPTV